MVQYLIKGCCFTSLLRFDGEEKIAEKWNTFNRKMNTTSGKWLEKLSKNTFIIIISGISLEIWPSTGACNKHDFENDKIIDDI